MPMAGAQSDQPKHVRLDSLRPGPIRHEGLTEKQTVRLRGIHDTFASVDGLSFEERERDFLRDANPDRELDIWEALASTYTQFSSSRALSPTAKREVLGLLLCRS